MCPTVREGQTAETYRKDKRVEHSEESGERTNGTEHSASDWETEPGTALVAARKKTESRFLILSLGM